MNTEWLSNTISCSKPTWLSGFSTIELFNTSCMYVNCYALQNNCRNTTKIAQKDHVPSLTSCFHTVTSDNTVAPTWRSTLSYHTRRICSLWGCIYTMGSPSENLGRVAYEPAIKLCSVVSLGLFALGNIPYICAGSEMLHKRIVWRIVMKRKMRAWFFRYGGTAQRDGSTLPCYAKAALNV